MASSVSPIISDKISNLPDEILCHILSFLPTNYAVNTSSLSKRWEHLWKYVSNICFDDRLFNPNYTHMFHSSMYKVLKVLRTKRIHTFSIKSYKGCFSGFYDYDVQEWIRDVIKLKVEQLELSSLFHTCPRDLFIGATTLVQLKLSGGIELENLPPIVCFPNLKILYLASHYSWNDERVKKLIEGCLVLEKLYIRKGLWSMMDMCSISSSSLTHLTFLEGRHTRPQNYHNNVATKLELCVPNLRYIQIKGKFDKFSVVGRLSSIIDVDLDLCNNSIPENIFCREIIPVFLKEFNNVKIFTIPSSMLKALNFAPMDIFDIFQNVTHLKIKAELCNWHLIPYILERSTNLQVLLFTKGTYSRRKIQERCWHEPRNVPKCLGSSLRLISIHGYQGLNDEIKMVKYFLENAQVLLRMEMSVSLGKRSQLYQQQIQTLHRAAMACEIVFLS